MMMMNIKSRKTLTRLVGAGQGRHKQLTTSASSIVNRRQPVSRGRLAEAMMMMMMRVLAAAACLCGSTLAAPLPPTAAVGDDGVLDGELDGVLDGELPQLANAGSVAATVDAEPQQYKAVPFELSQVTLTPGSRLATQMDANTDWLLGLNESRLTCIYTSAANLTCSSTGVPYKCVAGSEKPLCEPYAHPQYYGHFLGHYLSATALTFANSGNGSIKARADSIVSTLAKAQAAHTANGQKGFLFPYDVRSFQNLYDKGSPGGNCEPVCVPFYVLHKLLAGLLDQHTHAANPAALGMATQLADWVTQSVEAQIKAAGILKWQGVLDTEWGGLNEALFNLYAITGDPTHLSTGLRFNHWAFTAPLALGQDDLDGAANIFFCCAMPFLYKTRLYICQDRLGTNIQGNAETGAVSRREPRQRRRQSRQYSPSRDCWERPCELSTNAPCKCNDIAARQLF
jgi:hypothetical protein